MADYAVALAFPAGRGENIAGRGWFYCCPDCRDFLPTFAIVPSQLGRSGNVASAAETLRLGSRGRGPHRGGRGLRDRACGSAFRHGAQGKRERAAPRRHQARSAARHGARLAPVLHQRALRPCRAHLRQIIPRARPRPCTRLCERARRRRLSAQRGGREGRARLGRRRRRDRDAVRRRVERVRRGRAEAQRPQGRGHDRPAPDWTR